MAPKFLTDYGRLFKQSGIMEKIIPRRLNSAADLKRLAPATIRDGRYEKADLKGINEVSDLMIDTQRAFSTQFMTYWTAAENAGDPYSG